MNFDGFPPDFSGVRVHFVGIKGTGMAALVEILHRRGAVISGSDVSEKFYTDEVLEKMGIKALPFSKDNISDDIKLVVYSSAYNIEKNPDLIAAAEKKIPAILYSQALGLYSKTAFSCGVCGVHGKTSTTGLCGTIFKELNLSGQVLAGSVISSFGGSCTWTSPSVNESSDGKKPYFIAETCEYQRHFMAFEPQIIILTSVESDHQDYYPTFKDIQNAFVDYILKLPQSGALIFCADDEGAVQTARIASEKRGDIRLVPYGKNADGAYRIQNWKVKDAKQYWTIDGFGELSIGVPGFHNVENASAAVALNVELLKNAGKNPAQYLDEVKRGLLNFCGGKRRSEIVGRAKNSFGKDVIFIDDYGHHPTAIKTTLKGFRDFYGGYRIVIDFMSHTYTRTAALLEEFASSFESADFVIINKIYASAREDEGAAKVSGEMLAEKAKKYHKNVIYCKEFDEAAQTALELLNQPSDSAHPDGWIFVTMGAGDNWKVGVRVLEALQEKSAEEQK